MSKNVRIEKLFEFISKKVDNKTIDKFYSSAKINNEVISLGVSVIVSLIHKIDSSYLGAEFIDEEEKMKNHFRWCFNQVINELKNTENIKIKNYGELYNYLYEYFKTAYYSLDNDLDHAIKDKEYHIDYFSNILELGYNKSKFDLENIYNFNKMFLELIY